jgi:predicted nucleotidyltransferase
MCMYPMALIEAHADELRALGAKRIGIFGSFARGEATAESDVDVNLKFPRAGNLMTTSLPFMNCFKDFLADP